MSRFRRVGPVVGLVLLAVAAFLPAFNNRPIEDDLPLLRERLGGVHSVADVPPLVSQSYWGDLFAGGLWRPLTLVVLAAQKLAFGDRLWAYRVVSLALHAAATVGVFNLARAVVGRVSPPAGSLLNPADAATACADWRCVLAAGLFAVHPIHAEAVITVYGQADLWAACLSIAALCVASGGASRWRAVAVAGLFALSLGFKESAIALPVAIAFLQRRPTGRWLPPAVWACVAVLAIYLPVRRAVLGTEMVPGVTVASADVGGRFVAIVVALATDLRLMLLPWGQTIYYGHLRDRLLAGGTAELFGLLAAGWASAWAWRERGEPARVGLVLLAVGLLPVAQFLPIGTLVAERTLYLPSVGLCLLIAAILPRSSPQHWTARLAGLAAIGLVIGLCWRVAAQWRDERTVWETTLADHPRSARAIAEVVRQRLSDPAVAGDPNAWPALHRMLDAADRITPNSYRVAVARERLATTEGDRAAAERFAAEAERLNPRNALTRPLP